MPLKPKSVLHLESASHIFLVLGSNRWPKFIPVNQHSLVIRVRADLARHHLDRYADLHRLVAQVSQLSSDHGAFSQYEQVLDEC